MFLAGLVVGSVITVIVNFILVKVIVRNEGKDDYFRKLAEKELDKQTRKNYIDITFTWCESETLTFQFTIFFFRLNTLVILMILRGVEKRLSLFLSLKKNNPLFQQRVNLVYHHRIKT